MTPALRTAILDALMERWRDSTSATLLKLSIPSTPETWSGVESDYREYLSSCLDMILPIAEPMIREAALREAAAEARKCASTYRRHPTSPPSNVDILNRGRTSASYETADACAVAILALGEPK